MASIVSEIEQKVVDTLQDGGLPAVAENSLDVAYEIRNALDKQGLACVVAVTSLEHQGNDGENLTYDANIEIQLLENPIVNRARLKKLGLDSGTAMDFAITAANALSRPFSYNRPRFSVDSISQTTQDGLVLVTVSLRSLV